MKIIHTSDWHLGQHFMGKSRASEHQAFLHWLLDIIEKNKIDAVIVAGDIFDTGSPPSYAREMYNRFIVAIQQKNCQLVILAGNHDSVATLNESKAILACLNTQVISSVAECIDEQVITLVDKQAEVGAILCAIPFIRPRDVVNSKAGQSGKEKQQALQKGIATHYADVYQQAVSLRDGLTTAVPIIATGHLTTVGSTTSESVRDIYIGTLDAFPANAFPPADYIALGHIHKSQKVAKSEHIRYSGSPIPLSFDETSGDKGKSVLQVEFNNDKLASVELLEIPTFQAMRVIKGDLERIEAQLMAIADTDLYTKDNPLWLEILVSNQDYLNDLQQRIQQLTADLPVEVLLLRRDRSNRKATLLTEEKETLNELSVVDVFAKRLHEEVWESKDEKQRKKRITAMFNEVVGEIEVGEA